MATASTIQLEASQKPAFYVPGISEESAETTSRLLQENHEKHHIFFNRDQFHVGGFISYIIAVPPLTYIVSWYSLSNM